MATYPNTMTAQSLDAEVESLYAALTGRQPFRYNAQDDPLYRSYADRYVQNGRMAMRDSMGRAAALTGGYGSSYAQVAGQQQYDEYLRALSEALPELYGLAYQQYTDEGDALRDAYDLAYQRQRDLIADQQLQQQAAYKQQQAAYKQRQDAYANLVKLISASGYRPSDAELQAAGLSRASADALRQEYQRSHTSAPKPAGTTRSYSSAKAKSAPREQIPAGTKLTSKKYQTTDAGTGTPARLRTDSGSKVSKSNSGSTSAKYGGASR